MEADAKPAVAAHLLVVDDHRDIRDPLVEYLGKSGYRVSAAEDAARARAVFDRDAVDLILLDLMMPGEDGLSFCRYVRAKGATPIIMLTALGEDTDRVLGLELGADDYVRKPFNPRELLARIRAVMRRAHPPESTADTPGGNAVFDRWTLRVAARELVDEYGGAVELTRGEYAMLLVFLRHSQTVLDRERLLELLHGDAAHAFDRSIDNQVSRLRQKIERDPKQPAVIKTVRGGGYLFAAPVAWHKGGE